MLHFAIYLDAPACDCGDLIAPHPKIRSQDAYVENLRYCCSRPLGHLGPSSHNRTPSGRWPRIEAAYGMEQLGTCSHTLWLPTTTILTWEPLRMLLNVMLRRSNMLSTPPTSSSIWVSRIWDTSTSTLTTVGLPRSEMGRVTLFQTLTNGRMAFSLWQTRSTTWA